LKRRVSAEEIAQSALGSFFRRGKDPGVYSIVDSSELAKLLATITLNKIRKHAEHHKAQKRDFRVENEFNEELAQSLVVEPANEQVQALLEVLEIVLQGYDERDVEIVGLAREGFSAEEIASRTNCSQTTVRRVLARIFSQLRKLLSENSNE
jgi:RNA polymerase sigma factor (sigma-70 family)